RAAQSARIQRRAEREVSLEAQLTLLRHRVDQLELRLSARARPARPRAVGFGGLEADRISCGQYVLVEPEVQLEPAADQVAVLRPAMPHQPAVQRRSAPWRVGDEHEGDVARVYL